MTNPIFAAGNRQAVIDTARDCWHYLDKARIERNSDARFVGTIVSIISTITAIAGSAASLASAVSGQNSNSPDGLQINVCVQNLTSYIMTLKSIENSNTRVVNSCVINPGEVVGYPLYFRDGPSLNVCNLEFGVRGVDGNNSSIVVNFDRRDGVTLRNAIIAERLLPGQWRIDPRESRPTILHGDSFTIYCTSVLERPCRSQVANLDLAIIEK